MGDILAVSASVNVQGCVLSAFVTAENQVRVIAYNLTGAPQTIPTTGLAITATKRPGQRY